MTEEEKSARSAEKVRQIKQLCDLLHVNISAEQMITKEGLIKNVVYYYDLETYPEPIKKIEESSEDTSVRE